MDDKFGDVKLPSIGDMIRENARRDGYNEGLAAGLAVAREIASWMGGSMEAKAKEQIDRMAVALQGERN